MAIVSVVLNVIVAALFPSREPTLS
jgi:hypothetical protein